MGSGGTPALVAAFSGAGGGRIIPGAASGSLSVNFSPDNNALFTDVGLPGGGPGQVGGTSGNGEGSLVGGGGGWGAAGGLGPAGLTDDPNDPAGTLAGPNGLGGAGGKAINTNGHAVTWIGGASRAYGAIG